MQERNENSKQSLTLRNGVSMPLLGFGVSSFSPERLTDLCLNSEGCNFRKHSRRYYSSQWKKISPRTALRSITLGMLTFHLNSRIRSITPIIIAAGLMAESTT